MATFIRPGSYSGCTIRVHGGQYYNGYENEEEELTNVPLKSLQLTSVSTELQDKLSRLASMPGVMAAV
jgi:hypothetical protein